MSGIGHNSGNVTLNTSAQRQLRSIIERIENVEADQVGLAEDKKEIYLEAKGSGYDVKILRKVVAMRKKDPAKLQEEEALVDLYTHALGSPERAAPEDDDDADGIA